MGSSPKSPPRFSWFDIYCYGVNFNLGVGILAIPFTFFYSGL